MMRAVVAAVSRRSVRSALMKCSATVPCGECQSRSLALPVEVGHGKTRKQALSPTQEMPPKVERSPESERAALAEYERMSKTTERLIGTQTLTAASIQELRAVLHYWVSGRSRSLLAAKNEPEKALQNAKDLVEWMLSTQNEPNVLQEVFRTDECASGAIINMLEEYLMPFRGTHQSLIVTDRRLRFQRSVDELKEALLKATELMDRLQQLHDDSSYPELVPDHFTSNMILNLWLKRCSFLAEYSDSIDDDFVQEALKGVSSVEECLAAMETCAHTLPSVDAQSYGMLLLSAWANSGLPNRAEEAHARLRKLENDPSVASLNTIAYNTVLYAYASLAKQDKTKAAQAEGLLSHMGSKGVQCDVATYSTMLLAHANSGDIDKALELLSQMEEQSEDTKVYPNTICYNIVLDSLAKSGTDDAAQKADAMLARMQEMYDAGLNPTGNTACPDLVSFTSVIHAWSRSSNPQAADKAEALLFKCKELSAKHKSLIPDIVMYNTVLDTWSRHGGRQKRGRALDDTGAKRAESLFRQIKEDREVRVDAISYNTLMNAWFLCGSPELAAARAKELMEEMKHSDGVKPDVITYNTVIKTVARSGIPGRFDEARSLIKEMEQERHTANTITYNTVIDSVVKSGERGAMKLAEEMVGEMEQKFQDGNTSVRPNEITYNIILHGYAKSDELGAADKAEKILGRMIAMSKEENRDDAKPSVVSFGTVLDAYARSGRADAAESLFNQMAGSDLVGTISYNTVLNALSKSKDKDAPHRAEALLNRMQEEFESGNEKVRPNTISFSSLLNCWANSDQKGAAERAEAILTRMEDMAKSGNRHVAPNAIAYSTTISAWSRSKAPNSGERAYALLNRMEDAYRNGQGFSKPNAFCYNATMNAVAKSQMPNKAEETYDLLQRMVKAFQDGNKSARPNVTSFSTVLNACAYTNGTPEEKREAFRIARQTFAELIDSDYDEPNVITYINFLQAAAKLLPRSATRDALMDAVFRECAQKGLVNNKVLNILRRESPQVLQKNASASKWPSR